MSYPNFYDPNKVGVLYHPRVTEAKLEGAAKRLTTSLPKNQKNVLLLLVDPQIDFIHEDGALPVPGAVEDTRRTIEWLLRNATQVTHTAASLDTHLIWQIMTTNWWTNKRGENPSPFTAITLDDYRSKLWQPIMKFYNYEDPEDTRSAKLPWGQDNDGKDIYDWNEWYLYVLGEQAKKPLVTWPDHCQLGTPGHAIDPALFEALMYHAALMGDQPQFKTKGSIPLTEHYSIMEPEVKVSDDALGGLDTDFLDMLSGFDLIYIAGQASSHCVLETINSIIRYFGPRAPEVLKRLRILVDCMSPVGSFEQVAEDALRNFERKHGLKLVKSTDPIG